MLSTYSSTSRAASDGYKSYPITRQPKPLNNVADWRPMFPVPRTPTVSVLSSLEIIFLFQVKSCFSTLLRIFLMFLLIYKTVVTTCSAIALGE